MNIKLGQNVTWNTADGFRIGKVAAVIVGGITLYVITVNNKVFYVKPAGSFWPCFGLNDYETEIQEAQA